MEEIRAVKARLEEEWLALGGVVAVGIGRTEDRGPGIIVSVEEDADVPGTKIPREVEGVPVEVRETGEFRAL